MRSNIIFTLTGTDRIGLVEEVTKGLLNLGGNIETSRMARLGGEFAILMLVSISSERVGDLDRFIQKLTSEGFKVTVSKTDQTADVLHSNWLGYHIEVNGADHEGIVHQVAFELSQRKINIESMETETTLAPMSGTQLFSMTAAIAVPPDLIGSGWESKIIDVGQRLNVDIKISETKTS